jgi:hypothetical protein
MRRAACGVRKTSAPAFIWHRPQADCRMPSYSGSSRKALRPLTQAAGRKPHLSCLAIHPHPAHLPPLHPSLLRQIFQVRDGFAEREEQIHAGELATE